MLFLEGSGCVVDGLQWVMCGDYVGIFFYKDVYQWVEQKEIGVRDMVVVVRDGSCCLQVFLLFLVFLFIFFLKGYNNVINLVVVCYFL